LRLSRSHSPPPCPAPLSQKLERARRHAHGLEARSAARSLRDLIAMLENMKQRGTKFRSLTEAIDTETPAGRRDVADDRCHARAGTQLNPRTDPRWREGAVGKRSEIRTQAEINAGTGCPCPQPDGER